jgi:hypothetical protein
MNSNYERCIEACNKCVMACEHCATECLKENDTKMLSLCIALTRECAVVCDATARLLSIGAENATLLCAACFEICNACAEECESDSRELEYCRRCAEVCRMCAEECRNVVELHSATVLNR